MRFKILCFYILLHVFAGNAFSQHIQPIFKKKEYTDVLAISFGKYDSIQKLDITPPELQFKQVFRSSVKGLDNRFTVWLRNDQNLAIINVRGTVATTASWMANVYAAMLPASGTIKLNNTTTFNYQVAAQKNAYVHAGWLISLGYIASEVEQQILLQYARGVKSFIISGHSQGGAITYLLSSHLYYQKKAGKLPSDLVFKTYCSAAPKPGNLYYAYDFDHINKEGWAFNIVNAADWVPETPFTIQQFTDLNPLNPFADVKNALRSQKLVVRLYAGMVYDKMNKSTRKAAKRYRRYLGHKVGGRVKNQLPDLKHEPFENSFNYMRAGTPVVLLPAADYFHIFPNDPKGKTGIWAHHTFDAYWYLLQQQIK